MSVTGQVNKIQYAGDGVTTIFAFPNTLYTAAAIAVTLTVDSTDVDTPQTRPADYSVTLAADFSTASITMVTFPASGETLTIYRVEPDTQTLDYVEGGEFPSDATEIALDKGTLESQTQAEQLLRCIKFPETVQNASSNAFDGETNKPTASDQYFQWNDTTKKVEVVNPVSSQTAITGLSDDDTVLISDTSDSGKLKKISILNLGFGAATIPDLSTDAFVDGVDYISGTATQLTLSSDPISENNTQITFDGVYQQKSTYTVAGAVITFDAVIPLGVSGIDVVFGSFIITTSVTSVNGEVGVVTLDADDISDAATTNKYTTAAEITKLSGIATGAQVNPTDAATKTAYEANANTNAYTDAEVTKLAGITAGANINTNSLVRADSGANVITTAGQIVYAHGLGVVPFLTIITLKCLTAEHGYSIGDVIIVNNASNDVGSGSTSIARGLSIIPDATNITLRYGAGGTVFGYVNKSTGASVALVNANWELFIGVLG